MGSLLAHAGPATPQEVWGAWGGDPLVVVALLAFVAAYAAGSLQLRRRAALKAIADRRARAAAGASLALALALVSPLDAAADAVFTAHMVQHLLLTAVAAPLLVLAAPLATIRPVLPARWRPAMSSAHRRTARVTGTRWWIAVATVAAVATLSIWHAPVLYDAALRSPAVHALEHATILGTAILFWSAVLRGARRSQALSSVAALAVASAHGAALGALLALAPRAWYAAHRAGAGAWGVDGLADQQVAGAIMWIPVGGIHLLAIAVLLHRRLDVR